jgi:hypothetical protein
MTTEFQAQLDGESVHCYGSIGNARGSLAETKPVVNGVIPPTSINSRTRFFFLEEFTLFMLGLLTRIE